MKRSFKIQNAVRIDCFAHALPQKLKKAILSEMGGPFPPFSDLWEKARALTDVDRRIATMNELGVDIQVVTTPTPPLEQLFDSATSVRLARLANDSMAELVREHNRRLVGVATVSLANPTEAIREVKRSVEELGLRGVLLYATPILPALDDVVFEELYATIHGLNIPIWLHPWSTEAQPDFPNEARSKYLSWYAFGWPYFTTLTMARLVFGGILERYPGLKVLVHHAGSFVPVMAGRMQRVYDLKGYEEVDFAPGLRKPYLDYFRQFYVDSITYGSLGALMTSYEFFGSDRMLFGTDMPFDLEDGRDLTRESASTIEHMMIPDSKKEDIFFRNALKLCGLEDMAQRHLERQGVGADSLRDSGG